jgi:hypothetical protein
VARERLVAIALVLSAASQALKRSSATGALSGPQALAVLARGPVAEASLDHDLGEGAREGYDLCLWMAEHGVWPTDTISVHSANPPGVWSACAGRSNAWDRFAVSVRAESQFVYIDEPL